MHKRLIEEASHDQLKEFAKDFISMLKATQPELYSSAEEWLYKELYGCHFNAWSLECALANMQNEDGSKGGHWSVADTTKVMERNGFDIKDYNEYDINYVMNMFYSDYYNIGGNDVNFYSKMTYKFLTDIDAPSGKAYKYYARIAKDA